MSDNIIQLNEQVIKAELKDLVKQSVEETLNNLLDQEAAELTNASKYERTAQRKGYRSGLYTRNLHTRSGGGGRGAGGGAGGRPSSSGTVVARAVSKKP